MTQSSCSINLILGGGGGGGQGDELFGEQNALKKSPLFAFYFIREGQHYIAVFLP